MPTVTISTCIISVLLIASVVVVRWQNIYPFVRKYLLRNPQYNYRQIFTAYLERFNSINDRRELYPAILSAVCRIIDAEGASLLVRDAGDRLQMKSTHGLKPMTFDIGEAKSFIEWLEEKRDVITRNDLVAMPASLGALKNDGIRWFVQFNAEASVPLFLGDRLYAIINIGSRRRGRYDSETRDLLKLFAVQFAIAIHNANLYQAIVSQNVKLQETSKFKTQLLANVSHELRTPLTSIIGLAELMAEGGDGQVNEEQQRHLSIIRQSGVRLLDTVTAMLDLSKLEVDKLHLNVQKINLQKLISQVASETKPNENTTLEVKVDDETPGVYGDEARLKQVVKHLLDNAVKFTKRGKISIEAEKCGEMLRISVKDTGIGIDKEKQKNIFEGFTQGDGSATREYDGLGLGLTISKKLVELHGGRIWLKSKVGEGSSFNFTLPLKPATIYRDRGAPRRFAS
jgi:signal transduction histidine kinase